MGAGAKLRLGLAALAIALAPALACAQQASTAEQKAVSAIAECLAEGLPSQWQRVLMVLHLPKPGAKSGDVQYLVAPAASGGELEPFTPCDVKRPARILIELRQHLPAARRGWTGARLSLEPDGRFSLGYDYPK